MQLPLFWKYGNLDLSKMSSKVAAKGSTVRQEAQLTGIRVKWRFSRGVIQKVRTL